MGTTRADERATDALTRTTDLLPGHADGRLHLQYILLADPPRVRKPLCDPPYSASLPFTKEPNPFPLTQYQAMGACVNMDQVAANDGRVSAL